MAGRNVADRELSIKIKVIPDAAVKGASTATAAMQRATKAATDMASKTATSFRQIAGAFTALTVARRAVGFLSAAVKPAMDFQTATVNLSVATGRTGKDLDALAKASENAAAKTAFSPTQAIGGMQQLALSLTDTKAATEAILPSLALAQTFFEKNVGVAIGHVSTLARAFNLEGSQVKGTLNDWIKIARTAGIRVNDMAFGFKKLGAAGAFANKGFADMAPLLALAVKAGVPAREASTGLFRAMQQLSRADVRDQIKESLGVITESGGELKNPQIMLLELAKAYSMSGKHSLAFKDVLTQAFGKRALFPIIQIMRLLNEGVFIQGEGMKKGADVLLSFAKAADDNTDVLSKMADRAMTPLSQQLTLLNEKFNLLLKDIFTPFVRIVTPIVTGFQELIVQVRDFISGGSVAGQIIGMLTGSLASFTAGIVAVVAAKMTWRAALAVVRFGLGATGTSANIFSVAAFGASWASTKAAAAAMRASVANGFLSMTFKKVGVAAIWAAGGIKLAVKALGPIFLLVTTLFDVWHLFGDKIKSVLGISSDKAVKDKKDLFSASQAHTKALKEAMESSKMAAGNIGKLDDVVIKWGQIIKKTLPTPSSKALGEASKKIDALDRSGHFAGKEFDVLQKKMALVRKADKARLDFMKTGEMPDAKLMKEASQVIAKDIIPMLATTFPNQKKLLEDLGVTGKAFEDSFKGSAEAAKVLEKYGGHKGTVTAHKLRRAVKIEKESVEKEELAKGRIISATGQRRDIEAQLSLQKQELVQAKKALAERLGGKAQRVAMERQARIRQASMFGGKPEATMKDIESPRELHRKVAAAEAKVKESEKKLKTAEKTIAEATKDRAEAKAAGAAARKSIPVLSKTLRKTAVTDPSTFKGSYGERIKASLAGGVGAIAAVLGKGVPDFFATPDYETPSATVAGGGRTAPTMGPRGTAGGGGAGVAAQSLIYQKQTADGINKLVKSRQGDQITYRRDYVQLDSETAGEVVRRIKTSSVKPAE